MDDAKFAFDPSRGTTVLLSNQQLWEWDGVDWAHVQDELPARSDENRFVQLTEGQRSDYASIQEAVRKLIQMSKKRPLTRVQHMSLMGKLGMMRMLCDTQYILDKETRVSPKLDELG